MEERVRAIVKPAESKRKIRKPAPKKTPEKPDVAEKPPVVERPDAVAEPLLALFRACTDMTIA
jgi:hypothetical protein